MARYLQRLSFGIDEVEWWVGWEIEGAPQTVSGLISAESMTDEEIRDLGVSTFQKVSHDLLARIQRRAIQRVRLHDPFDGQIGANPVIVVDLSAGGVGIAHERPIRPGKTVQLDFFDGTRRYSISCEVLRCQLTRGFVNLGEARYYSSLRLRHCDPSGRGILTSIVTSIVSSMRSSLLANPGEALAFY